MPFTKEIAHDLVILFYNQFVSAYILFMPSVFVFVWYIFVYTVLKNQINPVRNESDEDLDG